MYIRYLWQNLPSYVHSIMLHFMYCINDHVQGFLYVIMLYLGLFHLLAAHNRNTRLSVLAV